MVALAAVSALAADVALDADVDVVATKLTRDCWKVVPSPFVKVKFGFEKDAVVSKEPVLVTTPAPKPAAAAERETSVGKSTILEVRIGKI